jgi:ribosomal protein S18 acetylase RimI-like enzyme
MGVMKTSFRAATQADVEHLIALDRVAVDPARVEYIRSAVTADSCFVAETAGKVVGFGVLTHHFYGNGMIELLYVREDRRRSGIGGDLVEHMTAACLTPKLFASTNASNQAMQLLLVKHGFEPSGRIENLDVGDPELVYLKRLTS